MRHLDVATKSATLRRLARLAERLDCLTHLGAANRVDHILEKIAENLNPRAGDAKGLIHNILSKLNLVKNMIVSARGVRGAAGLLTALTPFRSTKETGLDNALSKIEELRSAVVAKEIDRAIQISTYLLSKEALQGEWFTSVQGGELHMEEWLSKSDLQAYISFMSEVASDLAELSKIAPEDFDSDGEDPQARSRTMTRARQQQVDPALSAQIDSMATAVEDLYDRMMSVDGQTEYIERSDPERFARVSKRISEIPNITRTQDLEFLHGIYSSEKRARVRQASLAQHQKLVDFLKPLIEQLESVDLS
jgi:uncharacterized protein YqgV (UPF0045/DUF77 family)